MHIFELDSGSLERCLLEGACGDLSRLQSQLRGQTVTLDPADLRRVTQKHHLFVARTNTWNVPDRAPSYTEYVIQGMAMLICIEKLTRRIGLVEDVVVDERRRGQGIGCLLMQALIRRASELSLTSLKLTSRSNREAAHALYGKLGFERYETNHFRLNLPSSNA